MEWGSVKRSYGQYLYNITSRLGISDDQVVIPTAIRDTILENVHLIHLGTYAMLDIAEDNWFQHIHRAIVAMKQNCKQCMEQFETPKAAIGKETSF